MPRRVTAGLVTLVAVASVVSVVLITRSPDGITITASSGSDPGPLLKGTGGSAVWTSQDETVGAWVEIDFTTPTMLNRIQVPGAGPATGFTSAVVTFDGDGQLLVTPGQDGDAAVDFPSRRATRVRVTVAGAPDGASSVSLGGLLLDDDGTLVDLDPDDVPRTSASSSSAGSAAALNDGLAASGDTGHEWRADTTDDAPWVQLTWPRPRELASVQIFGPLNDPVATSAPLHGTLIFDDGSSVLVSAIASGDGPATTLAFAPRMATSVRLQLDRPAIGDVALREFHAYAVGSTPPRWPGYTTGYSVDPPTGDSCNPAPSPAAATSGRLELLCPTPGTAITGPVIVVVATEPGTSVEASIWSGQAREGADASYVAARATADDSGRATMSVDTSRALRGPLTVRVQTASDVAADPLYVQVVNLAGVRADDITTAPTGMTLQWDEEFTQPLSVSPSGLNTEYSAVKPDATSNGQFGEAAFVDPADGNETLAVVDDDYLRIRTRPGGGTPDLTGADNVSGILASVDAGGAGFSAQYGFFEARMLGAPGLGTWPAFWMLNTDSAAQDTGSAGEVDAVELYGHNTTGSCHTVHDWGGLDSAEPETTAPSCQELNGFTDWALAWHTYGARVTPNGAVFTIDGIVVATGVGLGHSDEPFFFLLDLALGGGWPVDLSPTAGISDMYVDWVRVYT